MQTSMRTAAFLFALLASVTASVEAADGKVSGTAAFDGRPIAEAKITFHRADGQFFGTKIKDGKFSLDVLPPGKYVVAFQGGGIPEKYGSEDKSSLVVEMREGEATFDFDLRR